MSEFAYTFTIIQHAVEMSVRTAFVYLMYSNQWRLHTTFQPTSFQIHPEITEDKRFLIDLKF